MPHSLPTLILLPGLDGTGRFFWRLQRAFRGRVPVKVVTYPANPAFGYDDYLDVARREIGRGPVVLLGESFSGPIAVRLAAERPDQVMGLILAATFVVPPWPRWMIRLSALGEPRHVPRGAIDAVLSGGSADPELAALIRDVMAGFDDHVRAARLRAVAGVDVRADFARLSCPVLALHGRDDWLVWWGPMQRAIAAKPGAAVKLLTGPHMLLQTAAAEAAREIEAFSCRIAIAMRTA